MHRRKDLQKVPASQSHGKNTSTAVNATIKRSAGRTDAESDEDLRAQVRNDVNEENLLNMEIPPMPEPIMSADGSGQRLMITSIDVENFKSYYGKHVLGPFHQNFSAIIGPNGSGKSNVIDSLLFVFGYRASKIRSKKISVLIHSSAGRENISSCTVGVNFQKITDLPDGGYDVVPSSQFTVSRTAFRDNSSKYTYNGKTMQFKDIAVLLRGVGIDLIHNRFLILQGEVEQIALMKPKALNENDDGMLEYLEDIIGSSRLKVPIETIQRKIDQLQEERSAQLNRTKFAEKEKNDAEGPMKNLIAELRIDNGIALTKNRLLQADRCKAKSELKADEEKKEEFEKDLEDTKKRQGEVLALQKNRKDEQKQLQRSFEKTQEEYEKMKHQLSELEQAEQKRKAELLRLNDRKKKLIADIANEEKKIYELEQVPTKARSKLEEYREILNGIDDVIAQKQIEVDVHLKELQEQTIKFQGPKKVLEEQVGELTAKEDEASSKLTLAQEALQLMRREEEVGKKNFRKFKHLLMIELSKVRQAIPNIDKELHNAKSEMINKRKEEAECAENVRQCMARFEQKRRTVEAFQSQNNVLRRLMAEKSSGSIPGIYGRLGDLGAIDEKYDVAISTTCRPLDYIVVDNVDTAQMCVEFLRRENLGIASFLVLDKQEKLRPYMAKLSTTPENAPRLFDLIRVADPAVLPAFYFALRDTLIADDITAATRIGMGSKKRYRVVTLKGEVVETSGSMTGGGRSERRGRIGQSVKVDTSNESSEEVAELQKLLTEEQNRLNGLRGVIHQLDSRVMSLQTDCDRLKKNEQNLSNDIGPLERKVADLEHRLEEQTARVRSVCVDEKDIQCKKAEVAELTKARDKALEAADEVRGKVAEINTKIQEVYNRVVGPYQKELDEIRARKENASKGATKEQSVLNNAQRNMNKALSRKNDLETDQRETDEAIKKLELTEDTQEADINRLIKEKIQQEKLMKEAEIRVKEAFNKNSELDAEEVGLKKRCADLQRSLHEHLRFLEHKQGKLVAIEGKIGILHLSYVKCLDRLPESLQSSEEDDDDDYSLQEALRVEHEFFKKLKSGEITIEADKDGIVRYKDLPEYSEEEIKNFNLQDMKFTLANLEKRKVTKVLNTNGLLEYVTKLERYDREVEALSDISTKRDKHRQFCEQLKKQRMNEFMDGFTRIGLALKEMYQMITLGGDASLDLVDSLDPFSEGVSFGVRPPKKSWKQITNLSGGEKTLSSLALVFALHHYRPTPLYVMDEIDAALDFRNVSIIGHYIKDRTKNAQFIIISLRNNMFELADRLVGIYKTFDCTKSVAIDPGSIRNIIKPLHILEEMKNHKRNEKNSVDGKNEFQFQKQKIAGHAKASEINIKSTQGSKAPSVATEDLSMSRAPSSRGDYNVMVEKRKHANSSEKNTRILKGDQPSVSGETTPAISVSPPTKRKSPQKSEIPTWDVPQTITVRRSLARPTGDKFLDKKIGDSVTNKSMKEEGDDSCGLKNILSKDASGVISQSKAVVQSSNLQQSVANTVSDTDRLEQFARML
ncbi:SMC family domain-containing protein [Loa loa]|uniref:Structural maintenance of chromosomes protein n=1 Tax=Loa loa TaxID=7209 RepID=A0A1S0ULF9_LOALO|nr:SMC family domain-containing protein [Loa loa]EJD76188.1 SMC family domain-containing protein [Loa loa]